MLHITSTVYTGLKEDPLIGSTSFPCGFYTISDLYTGLTEDPLADSALRYHRQGKGLTLYSLGPNRRDDGGKTANISLGYDDIVWCSIDGY